MDFTTLPKKIGKKQMTFKFTVVNFGYDSQIYGK